MAIRSFAFAVHTQTCDSPESATWVTICPLKKSGFGSGERIGRERKAERGGQVVERGGSTGVERGVGGGESVDH